ncbi:Rv1678 family membrane protein [Pseudarthrobacter sp. N5]|uniref:Rv1678 family membrane protein n=1 Tax=Pseudarthrobacter sp. N5 TaxID=3418416 RepID=UPI003CE96FED
MSGRRFDRPVLVLGVAALLGSLFAFSTGGPAPADLIHVRGAGLIVIVALGVLAVLGGVLRRRVLVIVAGAAFVAAAVIQLLQAGQAVNWLGGDGSTLALMGGLGLGLLAVGLTPSPLSMATDRKTHDESERTA